MLHGFNRDQPFFRQLLYLSAAPALPPPASQAFYEKNADAILRLAGASAAKKRYRGSFQQWGIRWGSRESCSHSSQHRAFNNENSNLLFGSRDDFGVRAAGRNGAGI